MAWPAAEAGLPGDDIAGGRGDAAQAVTLSRTETTSVYGVEAPGSDENILLGAGLLAANAPREGQKISSAPQGEVRAVWMSYLTLEPMVKGKTKAQFTANVGAAFKKAADFGFNTVFVQVRPFGDALYASDFFPWSRYLTGTEGQDPGYDPLEIMCALADEEGLRIEAWLNPYRVRIGDQPMSSDQPGENLAQPGQRRGARMERRRLLQPRQPRRAQAHCERRAGDCAEL